jgi:hypothetical protein
MDGVVTAVRDQANSYYAGGTDLSSPVPEIEMLFDNYDYGVDNEATNYLFDLFSETGDRAYLLEDDTFKKNGTTYDYPDDTRSEIISAVEETMALPTFEVETPEQRKATIDDVIDQTIKSMQKAAQTGSLSAAWVSDDADTDTTEHDTYSTPGWVDHYTVKNGKLTDKVITALLDYGVKPKTVESFESEKLPEGSHDLSDEERAYLAEVTYGALDKYYDVLDAELAEKIINKVYTEFKDRIIYEYPLGYETEQGILDDLNKYLDDNYFKGE